MFVNARPRCLRYPRLAMSFSCPHFRPNDEHCLRLNTDCVPGRRGCVLPADTVFAVPAAERVRLKEEEKRARFIASLSPQSDQPRGSM
jgi:hypothetical protein